MLGLAFMGSFELLHHNINGTIVPPILIEITTGLSFLGVMVANRNQIPTDRIG